MTIVYRIIVGRHLACFQPLAVINNTTVMIVYTCHFTITMIIFNWSNSIFKISDSHFKMDLRHFLKNKSELRLPWGIGQLELRNGHPFGRLSFACPPCAFLSPAWSLGHLKSYLPQRMGRITWDSEDKAFGMARDSQKRRCLLKVCPLFPSVLLPLLV
jgi:hypothetical protein